MASTGNGGGSELISPKAAVWMFATAAVVAVAVLSYGALERDLTIFAIGLLALAVVGACAPVLLLTLSGGGGSRDLDKLTEAIDSLVRQQALSEDARRVLNRRNERELLRKAIQEDILAEDYDAAMVLIKELAERFGYRSDAEAFREKIEAARFESMNRRIPMAIEGVEKLIQARRWDAAEVEAARIIRLYPDSPKVDGLRHRVHRARHEYKSELERRFLMAAKEERVDDAMNLLKELDAYLTEAEGKRYEEVARGVIGKARDNLGAQFKLAVHDRRWRHAAELGERIIESFPNSRMAEEVRGVIDEIRAKAASYA